MEHSNLSGCLENTTQLQEAVIGHENLDLHSDPAIRGNRDVDRNFVTVLVFCFRHIEYRENR